MNKFQKKLLKLSYENYCKTNNKTFMFGPKNTDDLFYYTNAAEALSDDGYIIPLSDNIYSSTIDIFDTIIIFEITNKGIDYVINNP